jgi:hypothetical protein
MFSVGPGIMPLSVEEDRERGAGVRKASLPVKYGARLIKVSASGGVMSHGVAGAQQYSDESRIVDEAHRAGIRSHSASPGTRASGRASD